MVTQRSFLLLKYGFHPFSCYGLSKVVGEEYCQMYREQYGLDIVITRFANVYGLRCHGVIHDFLDKIAKDPNKLVIIGTGQQCRDFVHVSDVVEALIWLVQKTLLTRSLQLASAKPYPFLN
jgi:UDP-glucose 4-epimerase